MNMQEGTTMVEWFTSKVSKPGSGYGLAPDEDHTVTITGCQRMNIAMVASLHRELGKLIEGKIVRTDDGWQYLI
jgi:hypothetical protein